MENQTVYLNLLKKNKNEYANKYGVTRIGIFGSVARGEQSENSMWTFVSKRLLWDCLRFRVFVLLWKNY